MSNEFKNKILRNLESNGFPNKKVSLPMDKLYESADNQGVNLNKILEELQADQIENIKQDDKIIFTKIKNMPNSDMLNKAKEMMDKMSPEQMNELKEKVQNMSPEELNNIMNSAKDMGIV